jgi:hypothetical protein
MALPSTRTGASIYYPRSCAALCKHFCRHIIDIHDIYNCLLCFLCTVTVTCYLAAYSPGRSLKTFCSSIQINYFFRVLMHNFRPEIEFNLLQENDLSSRCSAVVQTLMFYRQSFRTTVIFFFVLLNLREMTLKLMANFSSFPSTLQFPTNPEFGSTLFGV